MHRKPRLSLYEVSHASHPTRGELYPFAYIITEVLTTRRGQRPRSVNHRITNKAHK